MRQAAMVLFFMFICASGIAQSMGNYTFSQSVGTYAEITGGTVLGNETSDEQKFVDPAAPLGGTTNTGVGLPMGFNFYYAGQEFDRLAVCTNGWISLGQSWETTAVNIGSSSNTAPLGSTYGINPPWQVSRVAVLAMDLQAQAGSTIRLETIGTAPYRVCVVQWKGYRKKNAAGENLNFQIRLEETTNKVVLSYGLMTVNATSGSPQVGMRAEPATAATNYANRTTTTDWSATTAGTAANSTCTLSNTVYPANGTTFTWSPPAALSSSYTIGSSGDFTTFAAAFNFLNDNYPLYGIPEGGTTFNVSAGQTFDQAELLPALTATGSPNRPIVFQKYGTGTNPLLSISGTTSTSDTGIRVNGGDYYSFTAIDIQNSTGLSSLERGFVLAALSSNPCTNNTISNCTITLYRTNANTIGVYSLGATSAGNNNNAFSGLSIINSNTGINTTGNSSTSYHNNGELIINCSLSDISAYGIYATYCLNLEVESCNINMAAGNNVTFCGIYTDSNTLTAEIHDNVITGNTTSAAAYGLYGDDGVIEWHHNTIKEFTGTGSGDRIGIYIHDRNHLVSANEVYDFNATGNVYGIYSGPYTDNLSIYNNEIHDLKYTGPTGNGYVAWGIAVNGTNITVANNMIYDLGSTGDVAPMIRGITLGTGTTLNAYFNTVYLKGGGTNTNFGSAGLYFTSNVPTLDIRNNIVVDLSTPGTATSGRVAAIWKAYSGFANFASTCDRNIYYTGTPGSKNLICYDNGTAYQTLVDYKNAIATRELSSLTENVPFVSTVEPYDIHLLTTSQTFAESNARPVAGWDFDFDNNDRNDTTPDIGADEGNFLIPAIVPDPALVISPADDEIVVQPSAVLTWTPAPTGGVPTGYRLYLGTDNPPTNIANGVDLGNVTTYDPNPDLAFLTTYYWKIVPYNATGPTNYSLCPLWNFETHAAPLTGTYIIGSTGYYPTFTLAITHLNAAGVGIGGVTYKAIAGELFAENPPSVSATGSEENPIVFTSTDTLAVNPMITPAGGTDTFALKFIGSDYVTIHHIDVANVTGQTNLTYGFWLAVSSTNTLNHVTIRNCNITLSRVVASYAIILSGNGSSTNITISDNQIDNASRGVYLGPSAVAYGTMICGNTITNATANGIYVSTDNGGLICNNAVSFPASTNVALYGIFLVNSTNGIVRDNLVSNGSTTSSCLALGLNGGTTSWYGNTVSNLYGQGGMEGFNGIQGTCYIYDNEFTALSSASTLYGLELSFEEGGTAIVYNNRIHDLNMTGTSSGLTVGILSNGTNNKFYNNLVYDLCNSNGTAAPQVIGSYVSGRATLLYNNTVYLNPSGTNANHSCAALYVTTPTSLLMNNNIFLAEGTPGASGKMVAFWKSVDGFANISASTDKNIYHAGTPGTQNIICYTPSVTYQNLDDFKAGAATFDQNSFTEVVPLVSAVSPYDLHITAGAPTLAESNGILIAEVTDDIDGDLRQGQPGYAGTGTAPDIGADEGEFSIPALVPGSAVLVEPINADYAVSINPSFTWYASAAGGTPTGYRFWLGSDNPPSNIVASADLGNVLTYECPVALDYLTTYYWKIVPYNDNGSAIGCPVWSFSTHQAPLTGNYIIGSTGYYPDFTHAIRYLNASGVGSGGVTFKAIAGEVFAENPPAITATGTSANPIVFTSTDTLVVNPKLTPAGGANTFGFKLMGGDFFSFDHIDVANASGYTNLVFGFLLESPTGNGCTDNTISACSITLNRSTDGAGIRSSGTTGRVNQRNRFLRNTITNARNGIYLYEESAAAGIKILDNVISDVSSIGIYMRSSNNVEISHNQISMASANNLTFYGINCYNETGMGLIHHNNVTGAATTAVFNGIYHTYNTFSIYNNTISGVSSSTAIYGIRNYYSGSGGMTANNLVYNLVSTGNSEVFGITLSDETTSQNTVYGLSSAGNVRGISVTSENVFGNTVHNLQTSGTGGSTIGIYVNGALSTWNNMIYDLRAPASTAQPQVRGFHIASGTQYHYHNTVLLTATGTAATSSSAAIYLQGATTMSLTLKNNIYTNLSTPGASGKSVAFWVADANFNQVNAASNNNIWFAGTPGSQNLVCYYGTTACQTLEDYKAANAGKDQNSFTENSPFLSAVSPWDLHLDPEIETYAEGNGLAIASVTTDWDGDPRDASHPDIGADEGDFTEVQLPPVQPVNLSPANGSTDLALNTVIAWAAGSGGGTPDYYKVYFGESPTPPLVENNYTDTSYQPAGMLPEHTYYWKVDAYNTLGNATGLIWSFTTRADNTIMEFPFLESFESGNTNGSTTINRWTQQLGSGSAYWTANTATSYNRTPRTGTFNVTLAAPASGSGDAWLFRPIYLEAGQSYELELWARQYTASGAQAYIQVRLGTDPSIAGMSQTIINIKEFVNGDYQRGAGTFTATSTGIWYLGIHGVCLSYINYFSLDDIGIDYYAPYPAFSIAPTSMNYGMVNVGETSADQAFVISNVGDADLIIYQSDIYLDGIHAEEFVLTDPGSDLIIAPGTADTLYVSFAPQTLGAKSADLMILDNVNRATHQIPLSGRGVGPLIPPCLEDFEDGWIDWVRVNGTVANKWELGTATNYRNSYSAYISSNNGATHSYNPNSPSYVHLYHDVTFPEDMDGMQLKFQWKGVGEAGFDYLTVHLTDTSFVPQLGETIAIGQIAGPLQASADWQLAGILLDESNAGQTKRLIFSWRNDGGGGTQPPAAIDNIRIYTDWPDFNPSLIPANPSGTASGGNISLTWDKVDGANDYIIEDSDMFDGVFTPIGRGYNVFTVPGSYPKRFFRVRATD